MRESYTLDDGKQYLIMLEDECNNNNYCLLSEVENYKHIVIRKTLTENDKEYFVTVTDEEYEEAISLFGEKFRNLFE